MNCTNKFLVSLPVMRDHSFKNSIVYINQHNADGAVGFIFNKPLDESISANLRKSMEIDKHVPVYYGGPVDLNSAGVIHTNEIVTPYSIKLNKELYISRDKKFIDIINSDMCPEYFKIVVGYSGWGPGQLESEILGSRTNGLSGWAITDYNNHLFWDDEYDTVWNTGMQMAAEKLTSNILGEFQ